MSARDDYPNLAASTRSFDKEIPAALDEIDRLRAEVTQLSTYIDKRYVQAKQLVSMLRGAIDTFDNGVLGKSAL